MKNIELMEPKGRLDRSVRVATIPHVILYRAVSRFAGGIGLPKAAEHLLERATSKESKLGKKFTPHAEVFLNNIKGKKRGVLFHFITSPLDKREKELAAQLASDYASMVNESVSILRSGFVTIKEKMGTVFFGRTPPLKHA